MLRPDGGHLLGVPGPERPVVRLALALQGRQPAVGGLLGLGQPRRLRAAEISLPAFRQRLYLPTFLLAGLLDLELAGLELGPQRLYFGLLRLDDGLVVLLELELAARRRALERLKRGLVPLLVARALLCDEAPDLLVRRSLQLLDPLLTRAPGGLDLGRVTALLLPVLCP